MKFTKLSAGIAAFTFIMLATSCKAPQNISYFQDETALITNVQKTPVTLHAGNKVYVRIKSKDEIVNYLFNFVQGNNDPVAYTIDEQGNIDFPQLGNIKLEGMTRGEAAAYIKGELNARQLVKDPSVAVDFANLGINIIGEVNTPGRYPIENDNINVLEALTTAGDLTLNGRRDNVKVIRDENGQYRTYTLNLMDLKGMTASPAFYLRDNDVIYVEPNDLRKRQSTVNGNNIYNTGFWISVASLVATLATTVGVYVTK